MLFFLNECFVIIEAVWIQQTQTSKVREDLYYRISGVRIGLLALRDRQDRLALIEKVFAELRESDQIVMDEQALQVLGSYHWPGNIRQLKNALQFALCMCDGQAVRITDLPDEVFPPAPGEPITANAITSPRAATLPPDRLVSLGSTQDGQGEEDEKARILAALQQHRWVVLRAAEALGVSRSTLHRKLKKYGLGET